MRLVAAFACAVVLICFGIVPGHADKRVALVIGNGDYQHADKLTNPVTDARRLRDALTKLGFEIVYGENLGKQALERAIGRFADAGRGSDVALVFFAGHGATFGDVPYVVPVDAQFSSLGGMPYELVQVETLIGELRQAKGLRIAILDACRDNAAERELKRVAARGGEVTRGLARVKNPEGLILAYATQYLSTAADGDPNGDSPFTSALLNHIGTPGLDVKDLFFSVGREVIDTTQGRQRPEISVSFYDRYALVPAGQVAPVPALPQQVTPTADPCASAGDHWRSAEAIGTLAAFEDHLTRFPNCVFAGLARARIEELKKKVAVVAPPAQPATPPSPAKPAVGIFPSDSLTPLSLGMERALKAKDVFKECDKCPEMIVVSADSFMMGSPNPTHRAYEEVPQHSVKIAKPFAVARFHVTVDQFAAFVSETNYATQAADGPSGCYIEKVKEWDKAGSWRNPGFVQSGTDPAVCISWNDAKAYATWLSRKTQKTYRLLTEAEWEYVARAGTATRLFFGTDESALAQYAWYKENSGGQTQPVGRKKANAFGLYDVYGNADQWVEDCEHNDYTGAPSDGSAWPSSFCSRHILRGGTWNNDRSPLSSASRNSNFAEYRLNENGFRLARTLTP